jgi:hypothetical protein
VFLAISHVRNRYWWCHPDCNSRRAHVSLTSVRWPNCTNHGAGEQPDRT